MICANFTSVIYTFAIILSVSTDISLRQFSKDVVKIQLVNNHLYRREAMTGGNSTEAYREIFSPPFPITHR